MANRLASVPIFVLVTLLIVVRFFTERVSILPRVFNAVDILMVPLLIPVAVLLWLLRPVAIRPAFVAWCAVAFTLAWAVAWLVNANDVHWLGASLLLGGLLTPILIFLILTTLPLDESFPGRMTRWLVILLVVNVAVATLDAVKGFGTMRDDFIFGTFGVNQNQLAFFLAAMLSLLAAQWRDHRLGLAGKVVTLGAGALFLLCGFQTLWVVFAGAMLLVHVVVARMDRRLVLILLIAVTLPLIVLSHYPSERFAIVPMFRQLSTNFWRLGKVRLLKNVGTILEEQPSAAIWGVGPGTFNSRAFRSIAIVPLDVADGTTDVAAAIVQPFYTSQMSARFIIPELARGEFLLSGANTDGPFTSYVSIPVELGLLGAVPLFGIYVGIVWLLARDIRRARDPDLRIAAMWALGCMLMLLGISVVDNYFETTRYTVLVWLTVALWYRQRRTVQAAHDLDCSQSRF